MAFKRNLAPCDEDDEESFCSNASGSYSDGLDSDLEEQLYSQIYHSNREEQRTETALVSSTPVESGRKSTSKKIQPTKTGVNGSSLGGKKSQPRGGSRMLRRHPTSHVVKSDSTISLSDDSSSDESVLLIDKWDSSENDILTNLRSDSSHLECSSSGSVSPIQKGNKKRGTRFIPITVDSDTSDGSVKYMDHSHHVTSVSLDAKMPTNKNFWYLDPEDLNASYTSSKRYYKKNVSTCRKCRGVGHTTKTCNSPILIKCFLCGGSHKASKCENKVCGMCYGKGHSRLQCGKELDTVRCMLCKMPGHRCSRCPDIWRRYHVTTTAGSQLTEPPKIKKNNKAKYCYNCGVKGHLGHECKYDRAIYRSLPSSPYIMTYETPAASRNTLSKLRKQIFSEPTASRNQDFANKVMSHHSVSKAFRKKKNAKNQLCFQEGSFVRTPKTSSASNYAEQTISRKKQKKRAWLLKQKLRRNIIDKDHTMIS